MHAHAAAITSWRWRPAELFALVVGFLAFPPIGLAVLAWKYFKEKNGGVSPWPRRGAFHGWQPGFATSGNSAFDAYKRSTLDRLEEERRKLIEEERAFAAFMSELKQAKDREEFDRFMASRGRI